MPNHTSTPPLAQYRYFAVAAALLAASCGPYADSGRGQGRDNRVNNLGHHSSNEDEKRLSYQVSLFDSFANKLFGRYRSERGELTICNTLVEGHARALYLERSVGAQPMERRLWLADPSTTTDSLQEYELLQAPASVACFGLPLQLPPEAVGKPMRSWKIPTLGYDPEAPQVPVFFVQATIDGKAIRYERAPAGMLRVEDQERVNYQQLHRSQDGRWHLPEAVSPDDALEEADTTVPNSPLACAKHACPSGTTPSLDEQSHPQFSCRKPDGTLHGPLVICEGPLLLVEGQWQEGKRNGLWKLHAKDGRVLAEASYQNGLPDGRWLWRDLPELAKSKELTNFLGAISFQAWQHGGPAERISESDDLIQTLQRGPIRSLQGEFKEGRLHGSWKALGVDGQVISERRYDAGFLAEHCKGSKGSKGSRDCTRFLPWRQVPWDCNLPAGPPRLFRSRSQLERVVPCDIDKLGLQSDERVIAVPGVQGLTRNTRIRGVQKGKYTEVAGNIDYRCGGARPARGANTLWLLVKADRKARLGTIELSCQPTP
jgi:hypothetical protein